MPGLIDIADRKFGRWTVIARAPSQNGHAHWTCRCDCGVVRSVAGCHLRNGKSTGCRQCIKWMPRDGIPITSRQWEHMRHSAQVRNIEFTVTRQEVYDIFKSQDGKCALTGLRLRFNTSRSRSYGTASLDRIDSSQGYTTDNIQWVHKDVNLMKGSLSVDQLVNYCSLILSHRRSNFGKEVQS